LETSVEGSNARAIDIHSLHEVLSANLQGANVGQKQIIEDEIERYFYENSNGVNFLGSPWRYGHGIMVGIGG